MDSAHAHPPLRRSPPATLQSRLRNNQDADSVSASPSTRQQQLLRTRNAKFPAKKLSISGISARFSQLIKANEHTAQAQSPAPTNQENIVYRTHKDYGPASHSASSLGILEEITNSIGVRNKNRNKRPPIPIYQDTPERGLLEESPYVSPIPFQDVSSLINSPAPFDHIQDSLRGMGLREISGNARKSSPLESPPFAASVRAGRRRISAQKSRFNSEEYIQHIERELELVRDAVYSPNTNRPWKEKLKAAKADNERLRKEIINVRSAFEAEVQKTVEHMTSTEVDLRRKVRSLEEELEHKESTIQSLECLHDEKRLDQSTVDTLKATIEKLESERLNLEDVNNSMSRRNEVLTQLLVLSPTKAQRSFDFSSPVRPRTNPRPKSMMIPRIPSSPSAHLLSRPQSVVASPSISTPSYFSPKQALGSLSTPPNRRPEDLVAQDPSVRSLRRSLTSSTSRRSTLTSEASLSPSSLDLQQNVQNSGEQPVAKQNPKRRTRRFLPGSTQLKPLLLPTLTGENGVLTSASTASPGQTQRREFSEDSVDPTTMFLSKSPAQYEPELDSYPFGHNSEPLLTQKSRQLAYRSLEGVLDDQTMEGDNVLNNDDITSNWDPYSHDSPSSKIDMSVEDAWGNHQQDTMDQWMCDPSQDMVEDELDRTVLPTNLQDEAEQDSGEHVGLGLHSSPSPLSRQTPVEIPEPLFSPISRQRRSLHFVTHHTRRQLVQRPQTIIASASSDSRSLRKRRKLSNSSDDFGIQNERPPNACQDQISPAMPTTDNRHSVVEATPTHSRKPSLSCLSLRSPARTKSPLEILQQSNLGTRPLAAITIKTIYGTLSRYTTYIREIKRDPLALARRVVANAWHANWALLGKLSWWVLGLFLGPSTKDAEGTTWDWDEYDGESIADRHCRRRSRELDEEHLLRLPAPSPDRHVRFKEQHSSYRTQGSRSPARPALKKKLSWGESLFLWGKFSVAIMLAVGGAVVKGPAEMLRDAEDRSISARQPRRGWETSRETGGEGSPAGKAFDERAFNSPSKPLNLPSSAAGPTTFKSRSPSPPPAARTLLRSRQLSSSPQTSSSPAFQFGRDQTFEFSSPCLDHDWGGPGGGSVNTLKPVRNSRPGLGDLLSSPPPRAADADGSREYDPESAGLAFFDPLNDVAVEAECGDQDDLIDHG